MGPRSLGPGAPTFVIAEAGVNHNGDPALAHELIAAAAATGADAVKFQTFVADELVTAEAPKAAYQERTAPGETSQLDMLRRLELPAACWAELKCAAEARGLAFLSTPFDLPSLALLDELGVDAIKVSSGDVTNTVLLSAIARTGRPAILSTGMSTLSEVARAIEDLGALRGRVALLHCVSAYPAPPEDCNLSAIPLLARLFDVPIGFSDHTTGTAVPLAAVALGACVVEKHLTLDRTLPGPDHAASLEPAEFGAMVAGIRAVESAVGHPAKQPRASEADVRRVARRSLVAARDLAAGDVLDATMIAARRPATGLPPTEIGRLVGRRLRRPLRANEAFAWSDLSLDHG